MIHETIGFVAQESGTVAQSLSFCSGLCGKTDVAQSLALRVGVFIWVLYNKAAQPEPRAVCFTLKFGILNEFS